MYKISKLNNENFFVFFIVGLFFIEFFTTIFTYFLELRTVRIVGVYKLIFQCFLILTISYRKIPKLISFLTLSLILIFCINQLYNPILSKTSTAQILTGSIYYFDRYFFIFIFIIAFKTNNINNGTIKKILKYIKYILFINAIIIIFGALTGIDFFTSYPHSLSRFGSDGLFNKVNEVSFIYMIFITHLYLEFLKDKSKLPLLLFIIISTLFIGTKTIFLFLFLFLAFHFVFVLGKQSKWFSAVSLILIVFLTAFYKPIAELYFDIFPFWHELSEKHNLITLLLSKRDILFYNNLEYIKSTWEVVNYFIGGPYYTEEFKITQMDGPDLYLFFGFLGTLVYFYMFSKFFLNRKEKIRNALVIIILFCGLLSGALLFSVLSLIYLFLVIVPLNADNRFIEPK